MLFCLQGADSPDHRHSQHSPLDGHRNSPSSSPQQLSDTEDVSAVSINGHIWFPDSLFLALIQRYYLTCGLALTLAGLQLPEHDLHVPLNTLSAVKWLVSQLAPRGCVDSDCWVSAAAGHVKKDNTDVTLGSLMWRWGRWCDVGVTDVMLGSLDIIWELRFKDLWEHPQKGLVWSCGEFGKEICGIFSCWIIEWWNRMHVH